VTVRAGCNYYYYLLFGRRWEDRLSIVTAAEVIAYIVSSLRARSLDILERRGR